MRLRVGKNCGLKTALLREWDYPQYSIPYDSEHSTNNGNLYSFHAAAATPPVKRR